MSVSGSELRSPRQSAVEPSSFSATQALTGKQCDRRPGLWEPWGARLWMLSFGCWSVIAVLDVAGSKAYAAAARYQPPSFLLLLTWGLTYAYGMALLTPAICYLSKRFPFNQLNW